jgi:DNA-binding SARP family transcriptional activator/tetratricopeptide (TPR) repeat protein
VEKDRERLQHRSYGAHMQLRLLGPLQLYDAAGPVHIGGPKERTVLAVLALQAGEVVGEDQLIDSLWPQDPPRTAARTLQSYVSRLRKALAASDDTLIIDAVPGGYRLRAGHGVLDVHRVEALAAEARDARDQEDHARAAASLAEALSAWTGRPLGEFADEPWAQPATARLAELRRSMLEERIDADLACGRHHQLAGELEGLCRANPFRERLWGLRMVALYRCGRQADALAVGRELRSRLVDELGVDPGPELQALERSILTQDASLEAPATRSPATESGTVPFPNALTIAGLDDFVGRADELDSLNECWKHAADGTCRAVFIGGEPGVGKSRLVAEFARGVHEAGGIVLFGTCEEDLDVPYQPFAEALRPYVARCSLDILRMHVRRYGGDLARVVPELALRLSDVPPPMHAEPEAERFRLLEATAAIIETAAAKAPVLIVLDDLQWANKPTMLMLRHVLRQSGLANTMIAGLYRDTETSDVLTDTLADLRRSPLVQRIALGGFDTDGVISYLEALGSEELSEEGREFAKRLVDETGGSPFFVREVVFHLVDIGVIARVGENWTATVSLDHFELPASVREVIGRRHGRLSEGARNALSLASVIGQTFTLSLLERANGLRGEELLNALEEAVDNGMIRDVPGAPGAYTFTHGLIRRTLYDALSVLRRARIHRRVAEAMEATATDSSDHVAEIAMHYLAGAADGVAEKAIEYATRAAAEAIARATYEEAVRFYEQALDVAEWASLTETTLVCDLTIGLASALWKTGAVIPSREAYNRAAELARTLGDAPRFGVAALRTIQDLGGFAHAMSSDQTYISLLEEALTQLGDQDTALHALLLARLSVELFFTPFAEEHRAALADRAVSIAERLGDQVILLFTLHCREWATAGPDVPSEERLIRSESILRIANELGDVEVAYQARFLRFVTFLEIGDFHRADEEATAGHLLAKQLGVPAFVPWVTAYDGLRAWVAGDLADADRLSAQALQEALAHRADPDLVFAVVGAQSVLFRYLRDLGDALAMIEPMVGQFPDFVGLTAGLALGYMQAGDEERCRRYFETIAANDFADLPREGTWLLAMGMAAACCSFLRDERRASILYDMLLPFRDRWVATVVTTLGPVERVLGTLALTLGRNDAAVEHLERAVELTGAVPAPLFHAEACYDLALALESGDPQRARELVVTAVTTADELCLATLREWTAPLAERLGVAVAT